MGKLGFVYSGQGDQYPGMGRDLYDRYEKAARIFALFEQLRPGTMKQCFSGSPEELRETVNTQPCLFAMELAASQVLAEHGIRPDAVAGFSLGEMTAAVVAGCFDYETGFHLVCRRGEWMQTAAEQSDTAMVAVVRLVPETVTALCAKYEGLYAVNFNCPGNITVSGLVSQILPFSAEVKTAGGRVLPLKVKGAFHSPFMHEAAVAFSHELGKTARSAPSIPLFSNVTGEPYTQDPAALLSRQIESPVQWEKLIRNMIAFGIDTFIEIGPGRTLTNMIKKIDPTVTVKTVTEVLEELSC